MQSYWTAIQQWADQVVLHGIDPTQSLLTLITVFAAAVSGAALVWLPLQIFKKHSPLLSKALPFAGAMIAACGVTLFIAPTEQTRNLLLTLLTAITGWGLCNIVRALFTKKGGTRRLVLSALRMIKMGIFCAVLLAILHLLSAPPLLWSLTQVALVTLAALWAVLEIMIIRKEVGKRIAPYSKAAAHYWHLGALAWIGLVFAAWASSAHAAPGLLMARTGITVGIFLFASWMISVVNSWVSATAKLSTNVSRRLPTIHSRLGWYTSAVQIVASATIWLGVLPILLIIWRIDITRWIDLGYLFSFVTRFFLSIGLLGGGLLLWELFDGTLTQSLKRAAQDPRTALTPARTETLLPITRSASAVIFLGFLAILVLSQVGVNTTPLIAGLSVVGVAIGFGAQNLVKDFISGIFLLFEGNFSVGDWCKIDDRLGVVERLTLRTLCLRDPDGALHAIPYGRVEVVTNLTKDFSRTMFLVPIPHDSNLDKMLPFLENLAKEYVESPEWKELSVAPPEVFGVDEIDDRAIFVKMRFTCKPGNQFAMRRGFLRLIKTRFDEKGIAIPITKRHLCTPASHGMSIDRYTATLPANGVADPL